MASIWFEHSQAHRWTWYSNAGDMAREIDHVLVDGHWRMTQNCRVYQSAQFLNTDNRLVVATLKLQLKSGRMVPPQHRLDVGKLKEVRIAEEFANRSGQVRNGSMRQSSASLRPLSAGTPGASVWPPPRQMPGPSPSP